MKYILLILSISLLCFSDSYGQDDSIFPPDKEVAVSEKKSKPMVHHKKSRHFTGPQAAQNGSQRTVVRINKSENKRAEAYENQKKAVDKKNMEDYKDR